MFRPKRSLCAVWLFVLVLLFASAAAAAGQEGDRLYSQVELYQEGKLPDVETIAVARKDGLEAYLIRQLNGIAEEIDLSAYRLTESDFRPRYRAMLNDHPELFFVSGGYYYDQSNGYVTSIMPVYLGDTAQLPTRIAAFNDKVNQVVAYANRATTPEGKLLLANDYFCVHYEYDMEGSIFSAEGFFANGKGVCQAYSLAFQAVLDKLGFESGTAVSRAMNHMWNVVKVNGSWYHLDVTWNDPITTQPLKARHNHLLLSDAGLTAEDHHSWTAEVTCTSTRYDAYPWRHAEYPLSMIGNVFYFTKVREYTVYSCDTANGGATAPLFSYTPGAGYSYDTACPVWITEDYFYYTTYNRLIAYRRSTGTATVLKHYTGTTFPLISGLFPALNGLLVGEYETASIVTVSTAQLNWRISITNGPIVLRAGETAAVYTTFDPVPVEAPAVSWSTDNAAVAGVEKTIISDADGAFCTGAQVTGKAFGQTLLTARLANGSTAQCRVVVRSNTPFRLPSQLTVLGEESLRGISAMEIIVPAGVREIGSLTFAHCPNLKLVELPDQLTAIAADAFTGSNVLLLCRKGSATEALLKNSSWPYVAY